MFILALLFFIAAFLFFFWGGLRQNLQMLQQNGYFNDRYTQWLKKNRSKSADYFLLITLATSMFFKSVMTIEMCLAILGAALIGLALLPGKRREIKPLVFTWRVWRLLLTVSLICLAYTIGLSQFYLQDVWWELPFILAIMNWLTGAVVIGANMLNHSWETRIAQGFIRDAKRIMAEHPGLKVIGITGSYGKTSTKHLLGQILGLDYEVLVTPESYNTTMGVVRTIRENLTGTHQVFIVEMGAKKRGDIREICDIVKPSMGILTSIGEMHLETFLNLQTIIRTKYELAEAVGGDGLMFMNYDNKHIREEAREQPVVRYGTRCEGSEVSEVADANYPLDVWAENILCGPSGSRFDLCYGDGEVLPCETALLGRHNVVNIVAAAAVAMSMEVKPGDIARQIARLEAVPHRLQLLPPGEKYQIIDDAFNANPEGAKQALEILGGFPGYRVLITPGIVELGEQEEEANRTLGAQAAAHCDYLIFVGKSRSVPLVEGAEEAGFDEENIFVAQDFHEALAKADELAYSEERGDGPMTVLLENDLPDSFTEAG